jgi:hypothetical protein
MSPHVSTDSRLTAEKVEKAKSRFAQGMLPGGNLYQRRCGAAVFLQHLPSAFCVGMRNSVVCLWCKRVTHYVLQIRHDSLRP